MQLRGGEKIYWRRLNECVCWGEGLGGMRGEEEGVGSKVR